MTPFRVWNPEDGSRPEEPNVFAHAPSGAAKKWVEDRWDALDSPEEIDVVVEDDEGHRSAWTVEAEPTVEFHVCGAPMPPGGAQ